MPINFNITELNKAKYDNFERNEQGLVLSCSLTDSDNNTVYVKNIEWTNEEPKSFYIQDKNKMPSEMWLMAKKNTENFLVIEKITNLTYGTNGLATSFTKTLANNEKFFLYDIEYNENKQIIYCKQRAENGTEREFFDFIFNENGKFISCTQKILGTNEENSFTRTMLKRVNVKSSLNELIIKIFRNDINNLDKEIKSSFLKTLTSFLQILAGIKSNQVNQAVNDLALNSTDVLSKTRYKLDTPLLQVFSAIGDTQSDINGEQMLNKILEVIEKRLTGQLTLGEAPVFSKICNNLSNLVLEKVFSGNYVATEFGGNLIELGFKLKAESEKEALSLGIKHIYYNVNNLLEENEIQKYHYKNLNNFILVKL